MEFELNKASDWHFEEKIEINTLEELQKLSEYYADNGLIIYFKEKTIYIYDDYME